MGEWSRLVGEHGEKIAGKFFELIGWGNHQSNLSVSCIHQSKHKKSTHGIDKFFSYLDPLESRSVVHAVASVKFSSKPYDPRPSSQFKKHFKDLAESVACFRKSSDMRLANKQFAADRESTVGVLFWVTSESDDDRRDISNEVYGSRASLGTDHPFTCLIDNRTATFIFDACHAARNLDKDSTLAFFYPRTGKNLSRSDSQCSGPVLPFEFLNAPVLPFVARGKDDSKNFILVSREGFTATRLGGLMALAKEIGQDFPQSVTLLFPDYNSMFHSNDVKRLKSGFADVTFASNVDVGTFTTDFRTSGNANKPN